MRLKAIRVRATSVKATSVKAAMVKTIRMRAVLLATSVPVLAACAAVAIAGCSPSATAGRAGAAGQPNTGVAVTTVSGYELPGGYANALEHQGNDAIFTVVVRDLLPARQFTYKAGDGTSRTYVYTPVRADITAVLKPGSADLRPGQPVTLRVLGGTTAGHRTINEITAAPDLYRVGTTVQIFSQPPFADPGTGKVQYVPNWSFAQSTDGMNLTNLQQPRMTIPLDTARVKAQQKADSSGWNN